jgi:hypothetical protein
MEGLKAVLPYARRARNPAGSCDTGARVGRASAADWTKHTSCDSGHEIQKSSLSSIMAVVKRQ